MSVSFVKYKEGTPASDIAKMRETARQLESKRGLPYLMVMKGIGMNFDSMLIMFHKDYSSYALLRRRMMTAGEGDVEDFDSFLIDLNDKDHFKPVTLSALAGYLLLEKQRASSKDV